MFRICFLLKEMMAHMIHELCLTADFDEPIARSADSHQDPAENNLEQISDISDHENTDATSLSIIEEGNSDLHDQETLEVSQSKGPAHTNLEGIVEDAFTPENAISESTPPNVWVHSMFPYASVFTNQKSPPPAPKEYV